MKKTTKKKIFELKVTKPKDIEPKDEGCQLESNEDIDLMFLKYKGFIRHYKEQPFLPPTITFLYF